MMTKAADGMCAVAGFSEPEQWRFDWEQRYTREGWLDQLPTAASGFLRRADLRRR